MGYELIAFDMDGTLLDSRKQVLPSSVEALREATEAGKVVAICSGRCPAMVSLHREDLPHVRYAICSSGGALFDLAEGRVLKVRSFAPDVLRAVCDSVTGLDAMIEGFSGRDCLYPADALRDLARYGLGVYEPLYRRACTPVGDVRSALLDPSREVQKIDVHCASREVRDKVIARLDGVGLELVRSESASMELSPAGCTKGAGLRDLAGLLGIPVSATIAVGDSDNDLAMLREAGLGLAMANANGNARRAADAVLGHDNDHGGCAEAVRRWLLGQTGGLA